MKEPFEFEMPNGGSAFFKRHARNTVLARFSEEHPGAIDEIMALLGYSTKEKDDGSGSVTVSTNMADVVLKGIKSDDADAMMSFLCDHITHFSGVEDETGAELDWKALSPDERLLAVDLLISRLDIISMFLAVWCEYQGIGARVKRVDEKGKEDEEEEKTTKKKRKRKTPEDVKEEAGR